MIKYITEAEDNKNIEMDVQVGPKDEIVAEPKEPECYECPEDGSEAEAAANCNPNPVQKVKMNPDTVAVAGIMKEGAAEFFVEASDIEHYAELTNQTMLEGLNDIIAANHADGMSMNNTVVVMDESTEGYIHTLERNGAACVVFEADDITVDVQVGPEKKEVEVTADPQEANPVDAVKRDYNTVVVAKDNDKFFMDVEDVQKCADIRCESVIETLNGIIAANESSDMCAQDIVLIVNENTSDEILSELEEAGVVMEANFSFIPKLQRDPDMKKYVNDLKEAEALCKDNGIETKASAMKACRIACRIVGIDFDLGGLLGLPVILTIIGIVPYMMNRAISWLAHNGEESAAKAEGKRVIKALDAAIENAKDEDVKAKLQKSRDKVAESMKKINSEFDDM